MKISLFEVTFFATLFGTIFGPILLPFSGPQIVIFFNVLAKKSEFGGPFVCPFNPLRQGKDLARKKVLSVRTFIF